MDVGDSRAASCDAIQVLRGVAVHGIHEVWPFPSLKILPVCGPRPGFRVAVLPDLVCAYLDGFLVVSFPGSRSRLRGAGHSTLRGTSTAESVRWGFVLRRSPHILGDVGAFVICLAVRCVSVNFAVFVAVRRRYVSRIIATWVARPYRSRLSRANFVRLYRWGGQTSFARLVQHPLYDSPARDFVRQVLFG